MSFRDELRERRQQILVERAKTQEQKNDESFLPWFVKSMRSLDVDTCRLNTVTLTPEFQLQNKHVQAAKDTFPDVTVVHQNDNTLLVTGFMQSNSVRLEILKMQLKNAERAAQLSEEKAANMAARRWMINQIRSMTDDDIINNTYTFAVPEGTTVERLEWAHQFHLGFNYSFNSVNNTVTLSGWL